MKDALIGVTAEIPVAELAGMTPEQATRHTMGVLREKARTTVEEAGGRFDVNRMQGLDISLRTSALGLGEVVCAIASWRVDAPDTVELDTGRPA